MVEVKDAERDCSAVGRESIEEKWKNVGKDRLGVNCDGGRQGSRV